MAGLAVQAVVAFALQAVAATGAPLTAQAPSALELTVHEETNLARTDPAGYADHLEEMLTWFRGTWIHMPGTVVGVRTTEGPDAVREAIAYLRAQRALPPLAWSDGLWRAARDHATDQAKTGAVGHRGSDGSDPFDRMDRYGAWEGSASENIAYGWDDARMVVMALIIDDGVPDRGHRLAIFSTAMTVEGVACSPHLRYRHLCVINYAGGFEDPAEGLTPS